MAADARPREDVRMHGFSQRAEVGAVLEWIDANAQPLGSEREPLDRASGRILAEQVIAPIDVPAFDRSAMDGYALHGDETSGASDYNPIAFAVIGQALPGRPFDGLVTTSSAVRIMTGAAVPSGADAVVPAEYAREEKGQVEITLAVSPSKHIGHRGEDILAGAAVLERGRCLRPQDAGLLASLGIAEIPVVRQPRVRIIVTGNEVVAPGEPKGEHQIYDANSAMLRGLVARDGGLIESHHRLGDEPARIRDALTAPGADVVLVSGGSSVGAEDHAPRLLAEVGTLAIHGVAMRPSSPAGVGSIGDTLVFLLPGNPVSCLCAYDFFAGRAIRAIGGLPKPWPYRSVRATLGRKISSPIGRLDYARVTLENGRVEPLSVGGASILSSTTRADGFVIVGDDSEGYPAGAEVDVWLYA